MRALKMALTAAAMLATAGCAGVSEGYLSPYGPGMPTPLPNSPGRGVWNPPSMTASMTSASSTVALYAYVQPFPSEGRPATASYTPELPTVSERNRQEDALVDAGNNQKRRMENRLENDRR